MKYALFALANEATGEIINAYVQDCNVDIFEGIGHVAFTHDIQEAKHFDSTIAAMEYWKRQSRVRPKRPDGRPNRPLTAYTMSIETV